MKSGRFLRLLFIFILFSRVSDGQILFEYDNSVKVTEGDRILENSWAGGLNSGQYGLIDFNGDSKKDLVIYERSSNQLNTFLNQGGQFIYAPEYRSAFPGDIEGWILFRDFDCDGMPDIFADAPRGLKVYRNLGMSGEVLAWELVADPVLTSTASGIINLQVNITDIPGISDLDGDGDLDILVYNFAIGGYIRHHKNMSVERTGNCGLDFEFLSRDWGYFEECDCNLYAFLENGETCEDLHHERVMHPGGKSLLLIDMDNDGDKDFFGGHEQCDELYFLENRGSPDEAIMTDYRIDLPDRNKPAIFPTFPAAFYDDFDLDGIPDLIVAPNVYESPEHRIDFSSSSWFYKNTGSEDLPDFEFITEQYLQSGMIDAGENAVPALIDRDGDGDLDLFIAANGKNIDGLFYGYIRYYENTGDVLNPEFELVDPDYLDLSAQKIINPVILFSDLNHDKSSDLVIIYTNSSDNSRNSLVYLNQNQPGSGLNFDSSRVFSLNVKFGHNDTPFFTDVNDDGKNDLLLGKSTGRLELYVNEGTFETPFFELEDPSFLDIDDDFITFKINLVPFVIDLDLDGTDDLVTTDYTGIATVYKNYKENPEIEHTVIYNPLTRSEDSTAWGYHTWLTGGQLFADEYPVLITGSIQGGLTLYRNVSDSEKPDFFEIKMDVYPNPLISQNFFNVKTNRDGEIIIFNNMGQMLTNPVPMNAYIPKKIEVPGYFHGLYIIRFRDNKGSIISKKLVKYR